MTPNQRGALWMMASMAGFALEDGFLKAAATSVPLGQILVIEGLAGVLVFAALTRRAGQSLLPAAFWSRTMALRSGFEVVGRLFYALAIALTPLSSTSAILQATPLIVVPGAALLFGEKITARTWTVLALGFLGVLIILRPGGEDFSALSLLAVAGMLGFAGRDLATRAAKPSLSNAQLGMAGFAVLAFCGLVLSAFTGWAPPSDPGLLLGACVAGIAGYACLTTAMRSGEVSAVTPFRYSRLVFALILGALAFGEHPDAMTLTGSALIVACGLVVLTRRIA